MNADTRLMREALALAVRGRGFVEPNPLVGAVVARGGEIVGRGWHQRYGEAHAEVHALADAGSAAIGATLYVTLEPCCHFGKTPPCTDAISRSGISRVVAAMADPFPQVDGGGFARLRAAGVVVDVGECAAEARRLNAAYLTLLTQRRPYFHAKWAMTLDGRTATDAGDSRWISGEESRRRVHALRGRVDAIVVGAGTVRADDPLLTARPPGPRTPARVVVSTDGKLPAGCQLMRTAELGPVLVTSVRPLSIAGIEVLELPAGDTGVSLPALAAELGRRRMTNVLVEGGARLFGSLLAADLIDEYHFFIAAKILGGGRPAIDGLSPEKIADARPVHEWTVEPCGGDWYCHGYARDGSGGD